WTRLSSIFLSGVDIIVVNTLMHLTHASMVRHWVEFSRYSLDLSVVCNSLKRVIMRSLRPPFSCANKWTGYRVTKSAKSVRFSKVSDESSLEAQRASKRIHASSIASSDGTRD